MLMDVMTGIMVVASRVFTFPDSDTELGKVGKTSM